jgi:hypothetical protein
MDLYDILVAKALSGSGGGGGGGGDAYTLLYSEDIVVENATAPTSSTILKTIVIDSGDRLDGVDNILYVRAYLKGEKPDNHFIGSDNFFVNYDRTKGSNLSTLIRYAYKKSSVITGANSNNLFGVWANKVMIQGLTTGNLTKIEMNVRYTSSSFDIDGTYAVEVYALKWPNNITPFDA